MANFATHTLVQISGRLARDAGTGLTTYEEIWSASIRGGTATGGLGPVADPAGMLAALTGPLKVWWQDAAQLMSNMATLETVKVNNIGSTGHYSGGATNVYTYSPVVPGGAVAASSTPPMFVTSVGTFLTTQARGRCSRGRITLPAKLTPADSASSHLTTTFQTNYAKSIAHLIFILGQAGSAASTSFVPRVYCSIDGSRADIVSVRVGQRMDTLNRRKNAVPEAPYGSQTLPLIYP